MPDKTKNRIINWLFPFLLLVGLFVLPLTCAAQNKFPKLSTCEAVKALTTEMLKSPTGAPSHQADP